MKFYESYFIKTQSTQINQQLFQFSEITNMGCPIDKKYLTI